MDRVITVCFYVHGDLNGLALESAVRTHEQGQVLSDRYSNLTVAELLCAVEALLDLVQPGDGWVGGCPQPGLF